MKQDKKEADLELDEVRQLLDEVEETELDIVKKRILLARLVILISIWFIIALLVIIILCIPIFQDPTTKQIAAPRHQYRSLNADEERLIQTADQKINADIRELRRKVEYLKKVLKEEMQQLSGTEWDEKLDQLGSVLDPKRPNCDAAGVRRAIRERLEKEALVATKMTMSTNWAEERDGVRKFGEKMRSYEEYLKKGVRGVSLMLRRSKGVTASAFEVNHTIYHFEQEILKAPWYEFNYD